MNTNTIDINAIAQAMQLMQLMQTMQGKIGRAHV